MTLDKFGNLDDPLGELDLVDEQVARVAPEPPADGGEPVEGADEPLAVDVDAGLDQVDPDLGGDPL